MVAANLIARRLRRGGEPIRAATHDCLSSNARSVDLSPHMLEVSRALNPECSHQQGDMRTVRLGTLFDAVFLGDALSYMTSAGDLALAIETAFAHCRPGGAVLFAPDHFRETYCPGVRAGGGDEAGRSVRYLEWNYDPDPTDRTVETDFAFLLRSGSGPTEVIHDHHTTGLFERGVWMDLCKKAGFEPEIHIVQCAQPDGAELETILCRRPG
ncbi:MAG: class I SAM-dependent methyltransferase [Planctomycetota bacterium]